MVQNDGTKPVRQIHSIILIVGRSPCPNSSPSGYSSMEQHLGKKIRALTQRKKRQRSYVRRLHQFLFLFSYPPTVLACTGWVVYTHPHVLVGTHVGTHTPQSWAWGFPRAPPWKFSTSRDKVWMPRGCRTPAVRVDRPCPGKMSPEGCCL